MKQEQSPGPDSVDGPARRDDTPARALPFWPAVTTLAIAVAAAGQLHGQGRRWWCACGQSSLWSSDAWGPHNSQHLVDPYSFTHVLHGVLLGGLLVIAAPRLALAWRLALAVFIECVWEVFENSAFVIDRYREATAAQGYQGDSVANSMGDVLCCAVGFWLACRLGWWRSLAVFLAVELLLLCWIRDCLMLNIVMLVCPLEAIRAWQTGG